MTIEIEAARNTGTHRAQDIIDPLIGSIPCALSRAKAELDARANRITIITLSVIPNANYRNGQLIEIRDANQGRPWKGKITAIRHRQPTPATPETELTIARHEPN